MTVCTEILFKILPVQLMRRPKIDHNIQLTKPQEKFLIKCILFITSIYLATRKAAFFLPITELRRLFFFFILLHSRFNMVTRELQVFLTSILL